MPDLAMCLAHGCPIRERCYRYTATPNGEFQAYFVPEITGPDCPDYIQAQTGGADGTE